jgi:hypothetical protein
MRRFIEFQQVLIENKKTWNKDIDEETTLLLCSYRVISQTLSEKIF